MKIIILTDVYLPYLGGGQIFLSHVIPLLCQQPGVHIEIVTRKLILNGQKIEKNEEFYQGRLKIIRLGYSAAWNNTISRLSYIVQASAYLIKKDFDLIDAQAFVGAIPGKIISILKKKPIILSIHGTSLETGEAGLLEKIILTKIKYNAQISVASNFLKFKNVNRHVYVVNPGVDKDFYKPDFLKKENNRILFVGRLQKIKGTEILLQCFNALKQKNIRFIIVGDGEEETMMRDFVKKRRIINVVFKGSLNEKQTLLEYQKASLFMLPSLSEGFPLTLLEAMSCGLPCVTSDVGDVSKIIENNVGGFLIKPGSISDAVSKINTILRNDKLREQISANNLKKVQHYSWESTAEKIWSIYKKYD